MYIVILVFVLICFKVNVTSFGRAASAIHPFSHPLTLTSLVIGLHLGLPGGNYFTPSFECSQHTVPRNITGPIMVKT